MKKVAIVEFGMGNLDSVSRAVEECGGSPIVTNKESELETANYIILPGVGAFSVGMQNIRERGLDEILEEQVLKNNIPFLGICLGMQLLAEKGWEGGETPGLGWIEGEVERLEPLNSTERVPHVGWNEVIFRNTCPLFKDVAPNKDFYFVHSFHFVCRNAENVIAQTPFCGKFVSGVSKGNIFGVQFHPEKSQRPGFQVLRNFLSL